MVSIGQKIVRNINVMSDMFSYMRSVGRVGKEPDHNWESTLDWAAQDAYMGIMGVMQGVVESPIEMHKYILEKLSHHRKEIPGELEWMVSWAGNIALMLIDHYDVYFPFAYSDVVPSYEHMASTYEINYPFTYGGTTEGTPFMAEPDAVESFAYDPENGKAYFKVFDITQPNFEMFDAHDIELLYYVLDESLDVLFESQFEEVFHDSDDRDRYLCMEIASTAEGRANIRRAAEFCMSAGLVWFCSPLSRNFRAKNHDVFAAVLENGEAIVYNGGIYSPEDYTKIPIPPTSCFKCGLDSYCVELVHGVENGAINVCNHCQTGGVLKFQDATCGSKFCKHIECPYHKYNGQGRKGFFKMLNSSGRSALKTMIQSVNPIMPNQIGTHSNPYQKSIGS